MTDPRKTALPTEASATPSPAPRKGACGLREPAGELSNESKGETWVRPNCGQEPAP